MKLSTAVVFLSMMVLCSSQVIATENKTTAAGNKTGAPTDDVFAGKSREVVKEFQAALAGKLQAAMKEGGPVAAIEVCKVEAPGIARSAGNEHGVKVRRVSDRVRNPNNKPDAQDARVLSEFAKALQEGEDDKLEKLVHLDGKGRRYYKAIQVQPLCLTCHGSNLTPAVTEAIKQRYPKDEAIGYELGDLRGAFVVESGLAWKPVNEGSDQQ